MGRTAQASDRQRPTHRTRVLEQARAAEHGGRGAVEAYMNEGATPQTLLFWDVGSVGDTQK